MCKGWDDSEHPPSRGGDHERMVNTFLPPSRWGVEGCAQCGIFTGIGPEAESSHVSLRIKYGQIPKKAGISPDPAAESNVGYIPTFWHAIVASSRRAWRSTLPWPSAGGSPWPGRRLGAFAQRGLAHCTYWVTCRELFGLFRAKRAILSLHAGVALAGGAENQLDTGCFAIKGMASTGA